MKSLSNVTQDECIAICNLIGEPYISHLTNEDGKWDSINGVLEIQIRTTSTANNDKYDGYLSIYRNGKISLWKNNGGWNGNFYEDINALKITDFLRSSGYNFIY